MKKVKLIKSFAGYPEGEYILEDNRYTMKIFAQQEFIHKDIVQGMKDHFEEVKERPTSWEELGQIDGYYVDVDTDTQYVEPWQVIRSSRDVYKTKEQAEASIALAQITQILDRYDIPLEAPKWYYDKGVHFHLNFPPTKRGGLLWFDTEEKRDHFYKHHGELVKKLAPFYIF